MAQVVNTATAERLNAVVPLAIMLVVLMMVLPIPPYLLDLLISFNITLSVVTLISTMYITRPVQLSVFPSLLLLLTLLRLSLNISSTRLILLRGQEGTGAAGDVIEAFGSFVVGGNFIIGIVISILLIAIQYVVINHGAVRISEVTARFTLDALPGKQMSIDADLNAGLIDEIEARQRRADSTARPSFYGAMDGAMRFTQRDAIASIIITAVNIVGGLSDRRRAARHGAGATRSQTYTMLTVGDGLVTVVPGAAGLGVGRPHHHARGLATRGLGADFGSQIFMKPGPLDRRRRAGRDGGRPGLPTLPFLLLAGGVGGLGWNLREQAKIPEKPKRAAPAPSERESVESLLHIEPLAIEVGLGLVKLVDAAQGGTLLKRIAGVRRQLASELGFVLPPVRVTDNLSLKSREYVVLLKGAEIARFELQANQHLAINPGQAQGKLAGLSCREPAFGLPAIWIPADQADKARTMGYTVVDQANVVATHLTELIRAHAHEVFSRQDTGRYLERVRQENPSLVDDLTPKLMSLSLVQRVLQNLLRERVSIRDGVTILEALAEAGTATKNTALLTDFVRQAASRGLVKPYLNDKGELPVFLLDPRLEQTLQSGIEHSEMMLRVALAPNTIRDIIDRIKRAVGALQGPAVLLCSTNVRFALRQIVETELPVLAVISHAEIPPQVKVASLGTVS